MQETGETDHNTRFQGTSIGIFNTHSKDLEKEKESLVVSLREHGPSTILLLRVQQSKI